MKISEKALAHIARNYPHSLAIVEAFVPLLEQKSALLASLPPCSLPAPDKTRREKGKAWLDPAIHVDIYLDEPFLQSAPQGIGQGIAKGFPAIAEEIQAIVAVLQEDTSACRLLVGSGLEGAKTEKWADRYGFGHDAVQFFAQHLASTAAERVAESAQKTLDVSTVAFAEEWDRAHCPVCGGAPHVSLVRGKDGQRFLQCALCASEWFFTRTTCPGCSEGAVKQLPYYFIEEADQERALACESCKQYILERDLRNDAGDVPLPLYLLCLGPLDILMQEKGYTPIFEQKAS